VEDEENDASYAVNPFEEEVAGHYRIHDNAEEVVDDMSVLACAEEVDHCVRGQGSRADLSDCNVATVDALAPVVQEEDSRNVHVCSVSQRQDNGVLSEMNVR